MYDAKYAVFLLTGGRMSTVLCNEHMSYLAYVALQVEWKTVLSS